jgi:biopolymer transport protein ExbD
MTSMMDILTVLLLFLLKSFVVDGSVVSPPPGVALPTSSSEDAPEVALVVAITDDSILVGEREVATVAGAMAGKELLIPGLEAQLRHEFEAMDGIDARRGREARPRPVTIQGDRDLEFRLLQRVMYTCDAAGSDELALAVVRRAEGGS